MTTNKDRNATKTKASWRHKMTRQEGILGVDTTTNKDRNAIATTTTKAPRHREGLILGNSRK